MEESASTEIQPTIASINNEDPNTRKEADIPGGNEKKNDELVIEIRKMVKRPEIKSSKQCRIYMTPYPLRKWNEEAYIPQVVSIGPFHHKNERLKAMEEHKERYFRSFVERSKINLECLVGTIREMEESIRGCYEQTIDLTSDRFVKMILVDASFILELFFRYSSGSWTSDDPIFVGPRADAVMLDLLLLENQLPFFVIEKLYHLAFPSPSDYYGLLKLSFEFFGYFNIQSIEVHPNVKIEHFTDLIRTFQLPPLENLPKRDGQPIKHLYSATQLHEAGVKFDVGTTECGFHIKFKKGVLKIPSLELDDHTEIVTRNIMALEQTRYIKYAYFTDYFFFMDLLINTKEDVDLLCDKKILVNYLGDNNAATLMINNLNKGVLWATVRDDYINLGKELNSFYENPWHRRKATLQREYFSTPWRTASTFAAIILLFFTFIQTIFSIISAAEFQTPYILFELARVLAFMTEQVSLPNLVTTVEAIAASRAVTFAKEIGLNSIVFDGELVAIFDSLKNDEVSLIDYNHLIEEAKTLQVPLLFVVYFY
ncbi:hypothetical protein CMV_012573 [Castanea mollissima]|uniref:Uncharacterized protein n=1 Tax=Castanea mollissima TaxID=60419 RepID=A0A8J4VIZ0_9ROSI|nr:hypothetical protein CMV_012573 [Castanea mollissima]